MEAGVTHSCRAMRRPAICSPSGCAPAQARLRSAAGWLVWRREGAGRWVEAARTPFESDAKAVVATMRARGDRGDYEVSEWS